MKWNEQILLTYFFGLTIHFANSLNNSDSQFILSIIHFSDFHGRFVEVAPSGELCYEREKDKCVGGIARLATTVQKLKKIRTNPIFLNAGDCFQGTLYYNLFKGNITARFMNELHPDVHTIGNRDFDDNVSGFVSYAKQLNSPIVSTNIDYSEEPSMQNVFTNSTIIRQGGKDIGIIGAIGIDTGKKSMTIGKLKFLNEVETINLEAKKLKGQGIEIIILLSHCGIESDKLIAKNCPDVDVIVGGHTHILLYNGKPPSKEDAYGEYPIVVTQKDSNRKVLIVHSGPFTKYMGDIQIVFDKNNEISSWKGNPIYLDQSVEEDPSFVALLKPWKVEHDRVGKRLIGKTAVFLNGTCFLGECNLANLITDAMIDNYKNESSISFITSNSIQNSIPIGPILYEDINTALPSGNTWNLIELKGSDLLQVLEDNVAKSSSDKFFRNYRLIQWSGLNVVYNLTNKGNKVVSVKVRCLRCDKGKFETLDNDHCYTIVVPNNLLSPKFQTIYTKHRLIKTGTTIDVDNLVGYIEKKKVIDIDIESRMVFV